MSIVKSGTAALVACLSLAGCNALYTSSSAIPHSVFADGQVPAVYAVTAGGIASASIDRSKEGVILSATLDEAVLPQVWGKVESGLLFNKAVDPSGADAALFLQSGSDYFAKFIRIGASTPAVVLVGSVATGSLVYNSSAIPKLPDPNLASDAQKLYYDAIASRTFTVATTSAGTTAVTGLTYTNVLRSVWEPSWKTGRDAAITFLLTPGRVLNGTAALTPVVSGTTWKLGPDDTGIPATWAFDQYWPLLLKAFQAAATTTTDGTSGATSE